MKLFPRKQAEELLAKYIENSALKLHCQMVATGLEAYAQKLGEDSELWFQTGLLHDLDWEKYPDEHPNKAVKEILVDYPAEMLQAILAHAPFRTQVQPQTILDKYLFATDEISGFLHAYSLMRPSGFIDMKAGKVLKKLGDTSFAANVSRDDIFQGFELIQIAPIEHLTFLIKVYTQIGD